MNMKKVLVASLASLALAGGANANILSYTASGTAGDGRPDNASATFDFQSLTHLVITLTNTGGPGQVGGISSSLTGIIFGVLAGTSGSINAAGTSAAGAVICTGAATCGATAVPAAPFQWGLSGTGTMSLQAGGGSFKPYGIMNSNITGNTDGNSNAQHNPWLIGPVVFDITLTGLTQLPTSLSAVTFQFGTVPDNQTGTSSGGSTSTSTGGGPSGNVPEPSSNALALLGVLLLSGVLLKRSLSNRA